MSAVDTGFGGYWGFDQTGELIGKPNGIRQGFIRLEEVNSVAKSLYSTIHYVNHTYPTAPRLPFAEKPFAVAYDRLSLPSLRTVEGRK